MKDIIEQVAQAICGDDNPANVLAIHRTRARAAIEAYQAAKQPAIDRDKIAKIDHYLENGQHDKGYTAFVLMRQIWPQLREFALGSSEPNYTMPLHDETITNLASLTIRK